MAGPTLGRNDNTGAGASVRNTPLPLPPPPSPPPPPPAAAGCKNTLRKSTPPAEEKAAAAAAAVAEAAAAEAAVRATSASHAARARGVRGPADVGLDTRGWAPTPTADTAEPGRGVVEVGRAEEGDDGLVEEAEVGRAEAAEAGRAAEDADVRRGEPEGGRADDGRDFIPRLSARTASLASDTGASPLTIPSHPGDTSRATPADCDGPMVPYIPGLPLVLA
jgi:hypothetical protein